MEQNTFIAKNFKLYHNNCFFLCKDENTSLKLNQMLSEPGLLPVPLSMLTESSSCEGDSFSDWPLASVTNIAADILPRPFCLFGSKHSFNAHWFSHKLCMRVTVSVNYCRTYKYYDWHLWLTFISNTTIHLISGDTLAIMCYFSMSLMVVFMAAKTTIMGWWYCEEAPIADDCDQGNHLDGSGGPISMRLNKVTKSRRCPYASVAVGGQNCNTGIIYKRGQVCLQDDG